MQYCLIISLLIILVYYTPYILSFQLNNINNKNSKSLITMKTSQKEKWDLRRFLKTARYYDVFTPRLPFVPVIKSSRIKLSKNENIWDRKNNDKNVLWGPLDDVVMGGASKSDLVPGKPFDGTWTGYTTTANNGGFAGIRTKLFTTPFDCSDCQGVKLRVIGDGQRYKLIMRDDADWNGVAWSFSFDTKKDKAVTINVPFNQLKPTQFAKVLPNYRSYDKSKITGIQMSLSKFEYDGDLNPKFVEGPFKLTLESITAY